MWSRPVEASLLEICAEPDLLGNLLKCMNENSKGQAKAGLLVQTTAKAVAALLQVRFGFNGVTRLTELGPSSDPSLLIAVAA